MGRQHVYNYSSSSDEEVESPSTPPSRRRHRRSSPQSSSTTSTDDKKKNKKNQKPPQESIDSIWEKFSKKKFSKALAVLPFAPVQASTAGDCGNELLEAGYERAAEECRRKVRKIISECKRINTRYRDPSWDLVSLLSALSSVSKAELLDFDICTNISGFRTGTSSGRRDIL